ncbi:EAL domain-containing protein [Rhodoferax sp. U2-2l]|uniref:EAL domain-containing protein n=1 Tax=Rhodoferax sp. U2-2l TaxID=2884000 RepID=UPI001D0A791C|nr:EAL domain-containing protein [Rhodoferax sp. U2-2l]MCB8748544.1 EAL domain-containing protein [Rhodoferax sp. U2-2l]
MTHPLEATLSFAREPAHSVTEASEAIVGLLGYTARQFLDGSVQWHQLVHADDQDIIDWLFSPDLTPSQGIFNIRLRHADGRIRCLKGHYTLTLPADQPGDLQLRLTDVRTLHHGSPAIFLPNFMAMMENTDDFIYFKDRNHVFTAASQTLVSVTKAARHWTDLIGKTDYDVFPEAYADLYYRLEKQVFVGNPIAHEVQGYLANDGHAGWVDNRKYPMTDAQGNIIGLFGIARDISDLKRAENTLLESEHSFKTIFEQLPSISVQGYDRQRRVIFWNQASQTLYGYTREQALGSQLEDLIIPEPMRDTVIGLVDAWSRGGPAIPSSELTLQSASGAPVEVFSSHVMVNNHSGAPELYCIDIDISERKKAEGAMRASETFLRTIIDEIPDPLVLKDEHGKFLLGNRAVANLYNTTPEAMVGKDDGDFGVPAELAAFFRQNVLDIMAKGDTQVVFEDSRDATTGQTRHFRSIKKPFKNAEGRNQILVIAQDVTDLVTAQRQVAESEQRLQHVLGITREGIWDWHVPTNHVQHNPQWYQTLLYAESEIAPTIEAFTTLIHPDDREVVHTRIGQLISGATSAYYSEHRMLRKDGQVLWVQDRGQVVERDPQGQPVRVIGSFADISYQKEHQNFLERIAHYDTLTGLPNRVLLADRMQQAMVQAKRRGTLMAVAYLDLDGFKAVNDRYGHTVGDQLLTCLAGQLRAIMREGDTMARLGGDEFVAVFVDLPEMHSSVMLINRLLEVAARPVVLHDASLKVSASVGVSFYPQSDDTDADQLLRQADQAMYSAKLAGKNRYQLFDAEHDRSQRVRHETLQRITQAMADEEFVLYYQPKVNLRTGEVFGAEALIRWQHPQQGLLAPGRFLPDIESHAISLELGEWVLHTAMKQLAAWVAQGLNLSVSVNISAHHLQQRDFASKLHSLLAAYPGVPRDHLELEVLETTALEELDNVASVIRDCASMGVGCALDDFGTGYSSLTYLKRLPAQVLKIDQSFVRDMLDDPEARAIVEGVLGLARAFDRWAVAEGAETLAHCEMLLNMGCDLAQGYGIARPMPADQMPAWVADWTSRV